MIAACSDFAEAAKALGWAAFGVVGVICLTVAWIKRPWDSE